MTFNIAVEREAHQKENKTYHTYFIRANIRGKDVRISVMPPDTGGYRVLDIVYGNQTEATLVVTPFEIKDASGRVVRGNTFSVQSYDENGEIYECPIKPSRISDKSLLNMMLK
jgi:hypothetical protein